VLSAACIAYAAVPTKRPPIADSTRCRSVQARAGRLLRVATHKFPSIQPADEMRWWHGLALLVVLVLPRAWDDVADGQGLSTAGECGHALI
jgi:hypothetical protein